MSSDAKRPASQEQPDRELPPSAEPPGRTVEPGTGDTSLAPGAPAAAGKADAPFAVPSQFGRYKILRALGQGAMGVVYLAEDTQLRRQVALKIPQLDATRSGARLERFYREARLAATLRHPNLCPVYDVGEFEGTHFISMAYIEGKSLDALLKSGKPQSERAAASLVRKVAFALEEAHSHGVVHRDLKPANIMIDSRGEPIVMDFGLARQANSTEHAQITHDGAILGTPSYMSPEQARGSVDEVGPPSDIYALGVILYQLLTGRLPFQGPMVSVLAQIATQTPAPPSSYRDRLSPEIEAVCLQAMAKQASDRFRSMAEFAAALTQYLRNKPSVFDQSRPGEAPRSRSSAGAPAVISGASSASAGLPPNIPAGEAKSPIGRRPGSIWRAAPLHVGLAVAGLAAALIVIAVVIVIKSRNGTEPKVTVAEAGGNTLITVDQRDIDDGDAPAKSTATARDYYWRDGPATQWHPVVDIDGNVIEGGAPGLSSDDLEVAFWRMHPTIPNGRLLFLAKRASITEPFGQPVRLEQTNNGEIDSAPTFGEADLSLFFRRLAAWPPTPDVPQTTMRASRPDRLTAFGAAEAMDNFPPASLGAAPFSPDGRMCIYFPLNSTTPHRAVRRGDGSFEIQPTNLPVMVPNVQSTITPAAVSNTGNILFTQDIDGSIWLFLSRTRGGADEYEAPERLLDLHSPTRQISVVTASRDASLLFSHDNGNELIVMRVPEAIRLKIVDALGLKKRAPAVADANSPDEALLTTDDSSTMEHSHPTLTSAQAAEPVGSAPDDRAAAPESEKARPSGSRKPARRARSVATDVFPVSSVWKGTMRQSFADDMPVRTFDITVTVKERSKNSFKATVAVGEGLVYEVDGNIRQNRLEWNTTDATIRKGSAGRHQYWGEITDRNRLELRFSGTRPDFVGTSAVGSAVLQEP